MKKESARTATGLNTQLLSVALIVINSNVGSGDILEYVLNIDPISSHFSRVTAVQ